MDLYAFTQWLRGNGVPESHQLVYRRGAASLLRDLGPDGLTATRLGEVIHALTLEGASPRAMANLQRIGEALLQFQEVGSEPVAPLPEPIEEIRPAAAAGGFDPLSPDGAFDDDDDAFLPMAKPEAPSAKADLPVAEPETPSVKADLPAAIEEEQMAPAVAASGADGPGDALELAMPSPTGFRAPAADEVPAPRPTGDLVRCPRCGRMQPRRAEGTCTACFAPFPHLTTGPAPPSATAAHPPSATAAHPRAHQLRRGRVVTLIAVAVVVGTAVGGATFGRQVVSGCAERLVARPVPAAGVYRVAHLGLTVEFPRGWRHATREDRTQIVQSVTVPTATFARGASVRRPDLGLQVAVVPLVGSFAKAPAMHDDDFVRFLDLTAHGAARNLAGGGGSWLGQGCETLTRGGRRLGRCRGLASKGGETWNMTTYVVLGDERGAIAVFGTRLDPEATRLESELIVTSMKP